MQKMTCNYCSSPNLKVVYRLNNCRGSENFAMEYNISKDTLNLGDSKIVKCQGCGFIQLMPKPDTGLLLELYGNMQDNLYLSEEEGRRRTAVSLLNKLSSYKAKGRLLDIGCSAGIFLNEARKIGWEVCGVELSSWAIQYAREKFKLEIFKGELKEARFPDTYFDLVAMADSIEHLSDPSGCLNEIKRILKPDGIIYISTPDIGSMLARVAGKSWWGVKHSHLTYFDRNSISKILNGAGFRVLNFSSYTRFFSLNYLLTKLTGSLRLNSRVKIFLDKFPFIGRVIFKINLGDQLEVYARRRRDLAFFSTKIKNHESIDSKMKTIVVLPAYNAAKTLETTLRDIPRNIVDDVILVDDASHDNTVEIAQKLGLKVFKHKRNLGYGANQKTCYTKALELGAEVVVMVHPDYQYDPTVIPELVRPILNHQADAVFGSRKKKGGALEGGMPLWKHNANILLTALENVVLGVYLTEYHSGFRAYSAKYLKAVNFMANSNHFVFDTEIIVQGVLHNLRIEEVPIHTRYFEEASTIKLFSAVLYGVGILATMLKYTLHKASIIRLKQFI
ncbi:MAG: methyltransferase domain-containing protein [Candidatus Omnitrophota bacterium]|jgi:ubiquinone/menaquinone biosynthesis C-methylase UbiE